MNTIPTEPIPNPPPEVPSGLPPDMPQPPIEEPEPDLLPDEAPNPNPDENDKPPKYMGPKDPKRPVEVFPRETPDTLPEPERPIEEPGPDDVPAEAPDITPVPGEEIPAKMGG
ncbi:hypothetical protein LPJGGPFB_05060 [Ensifer adhaerens]|uniref:hypothetical protein n=1 Tax=Ensifer adhaerens TaxID=106592 RepID=UPI00156960E6|nr:hypothetical protein [Ensifer adhaerens]NRP21801.1 hypothetical protein [Ensifer adhaerens]